VKAGASGKCRKQANMPAQLTLVIERAYGAYQKNQFHL
jgi:hypothetical protein